MRRLAPFLALLACTASAPAEQPPPAGEPTVDPDRLQLEQGELVRIRGSLGACDDHSLLVVHADGRFVHTKRDVCPTKRPPGPILPAVRTRQLSAAELTQLQALLADPTLPHTLASIRGGSSVTRPDRLEFVVRTPTGEARGMFIGHRLREQSPFHAFIDSLYARL